MEQLIRRAGSQPSIKGSEDYFTGTVRLDPLFPAVPPSRVAATLVTFEPGARTAWHTHPLGQNLVIISGLGWTQCEDSPKKEIRPGDVVSCPCGKKHWHGATDKTAMSHIAIQEALDEAFVHWLDKVSDDTYLAPFEAD
ncbi:MAG: cupin domain-containing protein [Alphaproteobacteria bacterium]|nr:cupin domain-containing protein [Alphaproteobacteria bacterium]